MSSSTEISLRVLGRNVELLLDVDSEEPLEGFMACGRRAEWAEAEQHRRDGSSGREAAWHGLLGHFVEQQSTGRGAMMVGVEMW